MPVTLHPNDAGAAVGQLHQMLLEAGYTIEPLERNAVPPRFGASTLAAVRDIQSRRVGPDGHALAEDGVVGPATWWALDNAPPGGLYTVPGWRVYPSEARPEVRQVLEAAVGELGRGVVEVPPGSNRGERIDLYTAPDLGVPWCTAFVSWCYARRDGGSPFGRLLSTWKMQEWGRKAGRIVPPGAPLLPGDVGLILRADLHGHTVMVGGMAGDGRICTLEGNAGNAVRGLLRARESLSAVVRPVPA